MKIFCRIWFIISALLIFVSACVPTAALPTVTPDVLPSQLQSSATIPEPSTTATNTPTQTPAPTYTPRATRTPTSTIEPYVPPTIAPATVLAEATIEAVVSPCGDGQRIEPWQWIESLSPNGQWVAFQCYSEELGTYANITGIDSSLSWQVSYEQTYAANHEEAKGIAALVIPFHWSADGRYFYLTIHIDAIDGPAVALYNGHALYRLELASGQIAEVLPPVMPFFSYVMSISPNSRFLVYTRAGENEMFYVRDFQTGDEHVHELDASFDTTAFFQWSEDNKKLAFSAVHRDLIWGEDYSAGMSLFLLELETGNLSLLLQNPRNLYYPTGWLSPTQIYVSILFESYDTAPYIFDLGTMMLYPNSNQ